MGKVGIAYGDHNADGKIHGVGYWKYHDGKEVYKGTFNNGQVHGYGFYDAENESHEGAWFEGRPHGCQTFRE